MSMKSEMIYKVTYDAATIILNTNELVIYYASEPEKPVSYAFSTQDESLKSYEYCIDLMDYLEKELGKFEDIGDAHKRGLGLVLAD